jgi:DNA-binding protein
MSTLPSVIYIGKKPARKYLFITRKVLQTNRSVTIGARGASIGKAIVLAYHLSQLTQGQVTWTITVDKLADKENPNITRSVPAIQARISLPESPPAQT